MTNNSMKASMGALKKRYAARLSEIESLKQEKDGLTAELNALKAELEEVKSNSVKEMAKEVARLMGIVNSYEHDRQALRRQLKEQQAKNQGLLAELTEQQEKNNRPWWRKLFGL